MPEGNCFGNPPVLLLLYRVMMSQLLDIPPLLAQTFPYYVYLILQALSNFEATFQTHAWTALKSRMDSSIRNQAGSRGVL